MKRLTTFLVLILSALAGCIGCKQSGTESDDIITVDVTASYPKKELILQDFMDVEYIPLETSREFLTMGWVHAIGKEIIIVRNRNRASDGDIFIFDRNGKGLRKINRLGEGNEEYVFLMGITLDEEQEELFVIDRRNKIVVYDLFGKFKRRLDNKKDIMYHMGAYNFDRDHLLCEDGRIFSDEYFNRYLVISKQDGSIIREIEIPYKEYISSAVFGERAVMPVRNRMLIPQRDNSWTLMDTSSDTVYRLFPDYNMTPLVVRTPSIASMDSKIFLYPAVLTNRYCFMQTVEAVWDWEENTGHTRINLMYDIEEKAIYNCTVYNADFTRKQPVVMTSEITFGNNEIAFVQTLEAHELVEAYEKGELKGRLKEIAATLNEDDNPVIMLVKHKK